MIHVSWRRLVSAASFSLILNFVSAGPLAISRVAYAQSAQNGAQAPSQDRSQWRKLQRGMSKDDVRKLLGEPGKVSVAKYYEFWYYAGGSVTFDSKGRLDGWNEP
jgi:outer membrane protein assembly factor BamE (lipoprotein component of BamABCDE complex)